MKIDEAKPRARLLVERLYDVAKRVPEGDLRNLLEQAAVLLDEYQAGMTLATPNPLLGYALVHHGMRVQELDIETIEAQEIAP